MSVFTCSDAYSVPLECFPDGCVSNNIVWCCRLFDEPRFEGFELLHVFDCLRDVPDLCFGSALREV